MYKSFLHQVPESPQRPDVEKRIAELQTLIEQQRKTQQAPPDGTMPTKSTGVTTPAVAAASTAAPTSPVEKHAPWYTDRAAVSMAAVGVAALGVGVGLTVKGNLDLSHANSAADLQQHDDLRSSGMTFSIAGYAMLGVGAALCAAALMKWAVRPRTRRLAVNVDGNSSSSSLTFGGAF